MKPCFRPLARLSALILLLAALGRPALAAPLELSLEESIALALKNNPEIKLADSAERKSLWEVRQAEAGKGFNLTFTHTAKRYNGYNTGLLYMYGVKQYEWSNKYDNLLSLSLPLYTGGKLEGQIDAARLNHKVAALNVDATVQQLKQTVTGNYYNALKCRNNLEISRQTVNNYKSHLKDVQLQFDVGTVPRSDVLASEVSLANAMNSLIKAENSYRLAIAGLNNSLGLPLNSDVRLNEDLQFMKYALTLDDCEKIALGNRPELAQYEAKVAIARDDVKIANSGFLPTVNLLAAQDWYDSRFPGENNSNWVVGLTASISVFDSGLNRAKFKQAQEGLSMAVEQAGQKRDAVLLEVRQYYLNLREAEERIETSKVAVTQAEENLRIAEIRYNAGVGTNLEILDAVLALNTARTNHIQALYDYNTNRAQLERAMGMAVSKTNSSI